MKQISLSDFHFKSLAPEEKLALEERRKLREHELLLDEIKEQSKKLEEWQKKGMSIDIYKTFKEKGYWVEDLSPGSHKKVFAICKNCGKGRWVIYRAYHDLCIRCSRSGENNPNYGKHFSEETRKKMSESKYGENNPMYGKHHTEESRKKMGESKIGKHHTEESRIKMSCAKRGISPEKFNGFSTDEQTLFRASKEYDEWRTSVFERDNYTCQECGAHGGVELEVHHIVPYHLHPEPAMSLDVDNGITLCKHCHAKTKGHEDEFYAKYTEIVKSNSGFKTDFLTSSVILECLQHRGAQSSIDGIIIPEKLHHHKKISNLVKNIVNQCVTYPQEKLIPSNPRQRTLFDF